MALQPPPQALWLPQAPTCSSRVGCWVGRQRQGKVLGVSSPTSQQSWAPGFSRTLLGVRRWQPAPATRAKTGQSPLVQPFPTAARLTGLLSGCSVAWALLVGSSSLDTWARAFLLISLTLARRAAAGSLARPPPAPGCAAVPGQCHARGAWPGLRCP